MLYITYYVNMNKKPRKCFLGFYKNLSNYKNLSTNIGLTSRDNFQ